MSAGEIFGRVILTFDPVIAYGDVEDHDAWTVSKLGVPFNITDITLFDPFIRITYTTLGDVADFVSFVGPPPIFRDVENGILRSFESVIPFP